MTDPAHELLENSLKIKNAARELFQAQLQAVATTSSTDPPDETDDPINEQQLLLDKANEERLQLIKSKIPASRTATEYLFLLGEVYKHAAYCINLHCEWTTLCWRLKGLMFHIERRKKKGRVTVDIMNRLWQRQVLLEMDIDETHHAKPLPCTIFDCECKILENYKFFFMKCHCDVVNGVFDTIPMVETRERMKVQAERSLLVVTLYFIDQIKSRYKEINIDEIEGKRNVPTIFYLMSNAGILHPEAVALRAEQEFAQETLDERELEQLKADLVVLENRFKRDNHESTLAGSSTFPAKDRHGEKELARLKSVLDVLETRLKKDSIAQAGAHNNESICDPSTFDPTIPGGAVASTSTGLPSKVEMILCKEGCSHDTNTCNCTAGFENPVNKLCEVEAELEQTKKELEHTLAEQDKELERLTAAISNANRRGKIHENAQTGAENNDSICGSSIFDPTIRGCSVTSTSTSSKVERKASSSQEAIESGKENTERREESNENGENELTDEQKRRRTLTRGQKFRENGKFLFTAPESSPERPVANEVLPLSDEEKKKIENWDKEDVFAYFRVRAVKLNAESVEKHRQFLTTTFHMFGNMTFTGETAKRMARTKKFPRNEDGVLHIPDEMVQLVAARLGWLRELRVQNLSLMDEDGMKEVYISSIINSSTTVGLTPEQKQEYARQQMEMFSGSHLWSQMKKKNLIDIERRRIIEKNVREIKEKEELDKLTAALERSRVEAVNECADREVEEDSEDDSDDSFSDYDENDPNKGYMGYCSRGHPGIKQNRDNENDPSNG